MSTRMTPAARMERCGVIAVQGIGRPASRAEDRINRLVKSDSQLAETMGPRELPFDGKRMFSGGFKGLVEA